MRSKSAPDFSHFSLAYNRAAEKSPAAFSFFESLSSSSDPKRSCFSPPLSAAKLPGPPLLILPPLPSPVPVFGAPAVLFLGMSTNDETVLEEAADFCSLTWIVSIIIVSNKSSLADAFAATAAAAAFAAAAAAGDDAEDEDDDDGLLLNPSVPTSFLKTFESVISFHWPVFAELTAITMILRGLSNTKTTFIGLKPEIDSPEID